MSANAAMAADFGAGRCADGEDSEAAGMHDDLKTGFETLEVREILQSPPSVLLGVSDAASTLLEALDIATVFDLASSRVFGNASRLLRAGTDPMASVY